MEKTDDNKKIVLFDGICNLCSGIVQFVLKHEKNSDLKFASLQSEFGREQLKHFKISHQGFGSIVFIEKDRPFVKSDAVLLISGFLKFPFSIVKLLGFIPRKIRDTIYDWIAANRYRIFGKKEDCWVPPKIWSNRFLEM